MIGEEHAARPGLADGSAIKQAEQGFLLGVVRAGRVAGSRANAAVLLLDQRFVVQVFVAGITPVLFTHLLVQPFGTSLGQAVGQGLDHDRAVVVALVLIGLGHFLGTDAGGGDETTDIIGDTTGLRRDEVGQRPVGLAVRLDGLLAQVVQGGQCLAVVAIDFDVVIGHLVGRPEAEHRSGTDQFFVDQLVEHLAGILVQRRGSLADHFVGEDARELASQVPGDEERGPVDVLGQGAQVDVFQHLDAGEGGYRWLVASPVVLRLGGDGLGVAQALGAGTAVGGALAYFFVFLAGLFDEAGFQLLGQQLGGNAHRTRGVGDVDHGVVAVLGLDLDRGVRLGGGGAADHQRQLEALALHFAGNVDHFVQ